MTQEAYDVPVQPAERPASRVTRAGTALISGGSLAAGFAAAQGTGLRWLGALVLLVALAVCVRAWGVRNAKRVVLGLVVAYVGLFVLAHVLALGLDVPAWLAVGLVSLTMAGISRTADR